MKMKNLFRTFFITFALVASSSVFAQTKNIVETAVGSEAHTTLVQH
jgi:hypothetical protein